MKWKDLTDEEQEELLNGMREAWPRFKNDHPRQKNSPDYNTWREPDFMDFVAKMNRGLLYSWFEFEKEYSKARFKEMAKEIEIFLETYKLSQPVAAEFIIEVLNKPSHFEAAQQIINDVLFAFPPANWPINRGDE